MRFWLAPLLACLERGQPATLVHVAGLSGSGPREVGAQMLVTEHAVEGTVGGGELEVEAIRLARHLLPGAAAAFRRWALGPDLDQCCGGAMTLVFEPFAVADLAWVRKLSVMAAEPLPLLRHVEVSATGGMRRDWEVVGGTPDAFAAKVGPDGIRLAEHMNEAVQPVWIYGAGHVGRALVRALEPLDFAITWIDSRPDAFADVATGAGAETARALSLAMPELAVEEAPDDAFHLVMTHSHSLDELICEAVLRRGEFGYLGLIGSDSKRARFRKHLAEHGLSASRFDRMICPIGVPGIRSKEPAIIAASVAADLLIRREAFPALRQQKVSGHDG
ncbi:xanthine dehydrogenase accessory factor [Faunimonas pinastri]|uniref:Xanthine dehydrogenase accessory factor n=1 Tax=Faunimonas pinastri TaxID=1855383 RepID=A0A1H9KXL1_9HYPH|nr:xanthine dehydrogenase accessory protein XdhC [Faunimonas pinastri]SER03798.1 xanthine dehydrogenase accessory factor [Faunimonas pinastri]